MNRPELSNVRVKGFLKGTVHSRKTKRKKGAELEGVEPYKTFYLSLDKDDVESLSLKEGSRLTIGLIKVDTPEQVS